MAKILVIEDERSVGKALKFELEDEGYDVVYIADYNEAVSAFYSSDFDLIISDIYLSEGNGVQLINMARRRKKNIPFIGITAFPEYELSLQARAILNDRIFEKPFFISAIKEKIKELLSDIGI